MKKKNLKKALSVVTAMVLVLQMFNMGVFTNKVEASATHPHGTACSNHHKNGIRNLNDMRDRNLNGTRRLAFLVTGTKLCKDLPPHSASIDGTAYITGQQAVSELSSNTTYSVRVMQHELSHNFGTRDNVCTPGAICIMGTGLDRNNDFRIRNIWCSNCQSEFNRNTH